MHSITINNCSAVLYQGTAPIEAHAGNATSINDYIKSVQARLGMIKVYGYHRLRLLIGAEKGKK